MLVLSGLEAKVYDFYDIADGELSQQIEMLHESPLVYVSACVGLGGGLRSLSARLVSHICTEISKLLNLLFPLYISVELEDPTIKFVLDSYLQ